ncbi:MAG: hypothetical protein NC242_06425 [Roseburia sp.]|nr:hypothetical protein [Roseburia sp.]
MKKLLDFIDGKEPEDDFTKELDEAVQSVRNNEKWRLDYMTLQMNYQEKYEQGIALGKEQGIALGKEQGRMEERISCIAGFLKNGGNRTQAILLLNASEQELQKAEELLGSSR